MVGVAFRVTTSRCYYWFGIEGRSKAVLYRRMDDEWLALAEREVKLPDGYVTLEVHLDGDGIRCCCKELDVAFFTTDTAIPAGRTWIHAFGRCRICGVQVSMSPTHREGAARRRRAREAEEAALAREIPDAQLVRTLDLSGLGGTPQFADFAHPGRYDMLVAGDRLRALSPEGELLWELPESVRGIVPSREHTQHGRLLYGLAGSRSGKQIQSMSGAEMAVAVAEELCVIQGADGKIVARTKLAPMDEEVYLTSFTTTTGNLSGSGPFDIALHEWRRDTGDGGFGVWAYNADAHLLWHRRVDTPYGHDYSLHFFDVDGDGTDELLVGGTLFSGDGSVIWVHDLDSEMRKNNEHYDAVAIGPYAQDASVDPVAFLLAGDTGVYVVDGLTGKTRMVHRIGHAQGRVLGRVRSDLPGTQVLAACRWGNMGILTLFSGSGDRLWSIQPDYVGQGATPVSWGDSETQLIWVNTSRAAMGLYDGYGRLAKPLPALQHLFGDRMRREVQAAVVRVGHDSTPLLSLTVDGRMHMFAPRAG